MNAAPELSISLADERDTATLGEDLALALTRGDLVCLQGDLGAGKTTLARALIRAIADDPDLEVPSPTFTLVQAYPAMRLPVAHFDLYRFSDSGELDELGLDEALDEGAVLVEWPERGEGHLPEAALVVSLVHEGTGRRAVLSGSEACLARVRRSLDVRAFLGRSGYGGARRHFLLGDASTRAYETLRLGDAPDRILMNAPRRPDGPPVRDGKPYSQIAHLAEWVGPFVAIDRILREHGFCAPEIFAADLDEGFLVIEHLGSDGVLGAGGNPIPERYLASACLLADLHCVDWPREVTIAPGVVHAVPSYDRDAMMIEAELLVDWYMPFTTGREVDNAVRRDYQDAWDAVFGTLSGVEQSLVLRDYHSPNIIWREARKGNDRIALIDFQDAMIGPSAYDLASLAQDARVTIPAGREDELVDSYCIRRKAMGEFDEWAFRQAYAIMAAQRASKILGIFVRLDRRDGKPHYLRHLPRLRDYLGRSLAHPALEPVRACYGRLGVLPEVAGS